MGVKNQWLPQLIDHTQYKNHNDFVNFLYSIFERDIKHNPPKFQNQRVGHARKILDCSQFEEEGHCGNLKYNCSNCAFEAKEDIFNHLTCHDNLNQRIPGLFDLPRAIRIEWIKKLIENHTESDVLYFEDPYKNKATTLYFWIKSKEYIVIVRKTKKNKLFLTTAFYVDKTSNYARNLEKKYIAYNGKKTPTASQ
jgi:hypothetical protein